MPLYLIHWPEAADGSVRWGQHTDWVIRADSQQEALELAVADQNNWGTSITTADLTCTDVEPHGPPEIILWYGPDA